MGRDEGGGLARANLLSLFQGVFTPFLKVRNLKTAELRHQNFYFKLVIKAIVIIIFLIFVAIISGLSCRCS